MTEVTLTEADLPAIDRLLKKMRAEESTPMLTLEEATWNLDGALTSEKIPLYRRKRIRAAVRDVALAAAMLGVERHCDCDDCVADVKAEIVRLLGDHPHG